MFDATTATALATSLYDRMLALLARQTGMHQQLSDWHAVLMHKTLIGRDGKLSPATMVFQLRHDPAERPLVETVAAVCACMHTAADLADDCEDGDLAPEVWGHDGLPFAINVSTGLLFLVYQAIAELPIDDARRHAIERSVTTSGWTMHVGQHGDLAATNRPTVTDHRQNSLQKTGAEIGCFFEIAAIALGRSGAPYRRLGEALGGLAQVTSDVIDVWLSDEGSDLLVAKQGLPIATALAADARATRLALAGDRSRPERQQLLRRTLCHPQVLEAWQREVQELSAMIRQALAEIPDEADLTAMAEGMVGQADELVAALLAAAPQIRRGGKRGTRPLTLPAIDQAKAFLLQDPALRESWDIQRWGLFGRQEVVGDVFGPALVGDILGETGCDIEGIWQGLSQRMDADGWRYFPGCREIPCDTDDLGYVLLLLQRSGRSPEEIRRLADGALAEVRRTCAAEGALSVYLYSAYDQVTAVWPGNDCAGSIASGLAGMAGLALPDWQPLLNATVEKLLNAGQPDGSWQSFYYPDPYVCTFLVVRALVAQRPALPAPLAAQVDARLQVVARRLQRTQRLDGGWGTPQRTAMAIATWLLAAPDVPEAAYARAFLEESQAPDGGWAAEPYFVTVGVGDGRAVYQNRLVTTAICLRALARIQKIGNVVPTMAAQVRGEDVRQQLTV
jgi:geranylgeranyl pyrophosphate synthase